MTWLMAQEMRRELKPLFNNMKPLRRNRLEGILLGSLEGTSWRACRSVFLYQKPIYSHIKRMSLNSSRLLQDQAQRQVSSSWGPFCLPVSTPR